MWRATLAWWAAGARFTWLMAMSALREIVQRGLAPRIAVLAGCGSAAATDEEGWGSIAAALLESGTLVVIATDRSVGDAASLSLMRDFYAQSDWRTDSARALARVQQALGRARGHIQRGSDEGPIVGRVLRAGSATGSSRAKRGQEAAVTRRWVMAMFVHGYWRSAGVGVGVTVGLVGGLVGGMTWQQQ